MNPIALTSDLIDQICVALGIVVIKQPGNPESKEVKELNESILMLEIRQIEIIKHIMRIQHNYYLAKALDEKERCYEELKQLYYKSHQEFMQLAYPTQTTQIIQELQPVQFQINLLENKIGALKIVLGQLHSELDILTSQRNEASDQLGKISKNLKMIENKSKSFYQEKLSAISTTVESMFFSINNIHFNLNDFSNLALNTFNENLNIKSFLSLDSLFDNTLTNLFKLKGKVSQEIKIIQASDEYKQLKNSLETKLNITLADKNKSSNFATEHQNLATLKNKQIERILLIDNMKTEKTRLFEKTLAELNITKEALAKLKNPPRETKGNHTEASTTARLAKSLNGGGPSLHESKVILQTYLGIPPSLEIHPPKSEPDRPSTFKPEPKLNSNSRGPRTTNH